MATVKCTACENVYQTERNLYRHFISVHPELPTDHFGAHIRRDVKCDLCASRFTQKCDLLRHYKLRHPENDPPYEVRHVCTICGDKVFPNKILLRNHEMQHIFGETKSSVQRKREKNQECPWCQNKFTRRCNMYDHIRKFHKEKEIPYLKNPTCTICKKKFSTPSALKRHRVKFHKNNNESEEVFWGNPRDSSDSEWETDVDDDDVVDGSPGAGEENQDQSPNSRRDEEESDNTEDQPGPSYLTRDDKGEFFECSLCRRRFGTYFDLKQHVYESHRKRKAGKISSDTAEFGIECHFCSKRFENRAKLMEHYADKHPPVKQQRKDLKHKCPHCDLAFSRAATVRVHVKRKHRDFLELGMEEREETRRESSSESESDNDDGTLDDQSEWLDNCLAQEPDKLYRFIQSPDWSWNSKLKSEQATMRFYLTKKAMKICDRGYSFEVLRCILGRILNVYFRGDPNAWLQIQLDSDTLNYPMISDSSADLNFVLSAILDQAYHVLGSNDRFMIDSVLRIRMTYISPNGRRLLREKRLLGANQVRFAECEGLDEYCQLIKTCWSPTNLPPDYGCLGSALAAGIFMKRNTKLGIDSKQQKWFKNSATDPDFQKMVDTLYFHAGVSRTSPQTWKDFLKFQILLNSKKEDFDGLQIVAYNSNNKNDYFFTGRPYRQNQKDRINLAVSKTHVYLIQDLAGFMKKKVCMDCSAIYPRKSTHTVCKPVCQDCKTERCFQKQKNSTYTYNPQPCAACKRIFHNRFCFNNHVRKGICANYALCLKCHKVVKRLYFDSYRDPLVQHKCAEEEEKCNHCHRSYPPPSETELPHYCHIKRPDPKKIGTPNKFYVIAYDYQTTPKKIRNPKRRCYGKMRHYPFMACSVIFCEQCFWDKGDWKETCSTPGCRVKRRSWFNKPLAFAKWLMYDPERRRNVKTVAFSHNGKRFDHFFPLSYLLRTGKQPDILSQGHQILMLKSGRVILKDFFAFFPQKLANIPDAFGFSDRIVKGYFPWRYPNAENLKEAVRPNLPEKWYYGPDLFKSKKEEDVFNEWYEQNRGKRFHLKKEVKRYCSADAEILGRALQFYAALGLEISGDKVNPMLADGCITLAGFVALVYRACFMPHEYAIGQVPTNGYNSPKKQSTFAAKYLDWMNEKRQREGMPLIRHKYTAYGEKEIGGMSVDGWVPSTGEAYQVHGCWYHAHMACCCSGVITNKDSARGGHFGDRALNRIHPLFKVPYRAVSQRSSWKDQVLRSHDDVKELKVLWECGINRELTLDPIFRAYWFSRNRTNSYWKDINIRDALYGGMTEAFSLSCKLTEEEIRNGCEIRAMDVVSMYPWVQLSKKFMAAAHPEVLDCRQLENGGKDWDLTILRKYLPGVACVFIQPPKNLYYPTLPCRIQDHTMFPLCWACAEQNNQLGGCSHTDPTERGIVGTYTLKDLEYALENNYKLIQVFEVFTYHRMPETGKLFGGMIKNLIKRKAESSDWPDTAVTPEERQRYLDFWKESYGVTIDPNSICENIGMWSLIKLFLVALWGKFAERPRRTFREYVRSWARLKSIVFDSRYKVVDLFFEDDKSTYALVCYEKLDEDLRETTMHNVVIGAHVTTYARHALLSYINQVPGRVLYCDTDGFIYVHRPGMPDPGPTGKILGQLSSELSLNRYIRLFQSLGPKNYRIEIVNREDGSVVVVWKAKGIMRTNALQRAVDEKVYQALIEQRLDHLAQFYEKLMSEKDSERSEALETAIRMARILETVREVGGAGGEADCCLYLPNPTINRDFKSVVIFNDDKRVKIMRLTATKRVYPPRISCSNHTSLPHGWHSGRDFLIS